LTELAIHDARLEQLDLEIALNFFEHVLSHSSRLWLEYRPDQSSGFRRCYSLMESLSGLMDLEPL